MKILKGMPKEYRKAYKDEYDKTYCGKRRLLGKAVDNFKRVLSETSVVRFILKPKITLSICVTAIIIMISCLIALIQDVLNNL